MLFNSVEFILFFVLISAVYFRMPHEHRWKLLLAGSYYFYMCWKPAYIILMVVSTLIAYYCGLKIGEARNPASKKTYLAVSLFSLLGLLFIFKYLNFFGWTVKWFLGCSATECAQPVLDILLPVGISFYTFQTLSYTIDVYRGLQPPEKRLGIFALYVSFFPQLVAGPIERSTHLLPQFNREMVFDPKQVRSGLQYILWGMFKKVVIADNLALFVNPVYTHPLDYTGPSFVVATFFFAFQIFCDFSGYSDIAIGTARILGFDLMQNFNKPYHAASVGEFWRRWHISLSTWFRDYLYIPLGGNRTHPFRHYLNLCIVFLVCGLWHGANWTFVIWGALHGAYMVLERLTQSSRPETQRPSPLKPLRIAITFCFVCFAWIFFRARNVGDAWYIVTHLFSGWGTVLADHNYSPIYILGSHRFFLTALLLIILLEAVHLMQRQTDLSELFDRGPIWIRWPVYYVLTLGILLLGSFSNQEFIYFQF